MKNFTKLLIAVVALGAVSCTNDTTSDLVNVGLGGGDTTATELQVTLADSAVRTSFGEATPDCRYPVRWSEGDKVCVNGVESEAANIDADDASIAVFKVNDPNMTLPYNIVYPSNNLAASGQEGCYPVYFAPVQHYVEGSFSVHSAPMCGVSSGFEGVKLSHLASVLRFSVTLPEGAEATTLKHLTLSTANNAPISGAFDVNCATGQLSPRVGAQKVISYIFPEGYTLSSAAKVFYVAVPSGEYEDFNASLTATDGRMMKISFAGKGESKLKPGVVREYENVEFVANANVFLISDAEDMMTFAQSVEDDSFNYDMAVLANDIDLSEVEWVSIKDFSKKIDGNEHTISGLTTPLFDNVLGEIYNLYVDANIVEEGANAKLGIIARTLSENCVVVNCKASGSVTYRNGAYSSALRNTAVGGLFGEMLDAKTIAGCTNDADVTIDVAPYHASSNISVYTGGVIGRARVIDADKEQTAVADCVNNGNIVWDEADATKNMTFYAGGVMGFSAMNLQGCKNYGDIDIKCSSKVKVCMGGVLGKLDSNTKFISCSSSADIIVERGKTLGASFIAGGLIGETATGSLVEHSDGHSIINFEGTLDADNNTMTSSFLVGGVVGRANGAISNVENDGSIVIGGRIRGLGASNAVAIGGIVAQTNSDVTACKNMANITTKYTIDRDCVMGAGYGDSYIGGVAGLHEDGRITSSSNLGDLLCSITSEGVLRMGGIVGLVKTTDLTSLAIEDCENGAAGSKRGRVLFNGRLTGMEYSQYTSVASVAGMVGGTGNKTLSPMRCTNYGDVEFAGTTATNVDYIEVAGIVGWLTANNTSENVVSGLENNGNVTYSGTTTPGVYLAGCVGRSSNSGQQMNNVVNNGDVTFASTATAGGASYFGGCFGYLSNAYDTPAYELYNYGKVDFAGEVSAGTLDMGGCAGYTFAIRDSHNEGEIVSSGLAIANYGTSLGGVVGRLILQAQDCTNKGAINYRVKGIVGTENNLTKSFAVGGVVGHCITSSSSTYNVVHRMLKNYGEITVTGSAAVVDPLSHDNVATANIARAQAYRRDYILYNRICVAGVIGRVNNGTTSRDAALNISVTLDSCLNVGNINLLEGGRPRYVSLAGIVGDVSTKKYTHYRCENRGNIRAEIIGTESSQFLQLAGHVGFIYQRMCERAEMEIIESTNRGNIHLRESSSCMEFARAGGILSNAVSTYYNSVPYVLALTIRDCENYGNISRYTTSLQATQSFAGGIAALIGPADDGNEELAATEFLCQTCTNYGTIQFEPATESGPVGYTVNSSFVGGIVGLVKGGREPSTSDSDLRLPTILSCVNKGKVIGWFGCLGGIVGKLRNYGQCLGTADAYCINEGDVGVRRDLQGNVITEPKYYLTNVNGNLMQAYAGGIVGYSAESNYESSYVAYNKCVVRYGLNRGIVGGVYAGGITGYCNASSTFHDHHIKYSKNSGKVYGFGGTAGAITAQIPTQSKYGDSLGLVESSAVGGEVYRGTQSSAVVPDNFYNYIYGQNVVNAGQNEWWDGESPTSWEE